MNLRDALAGPKGSLDLWLEDLTEDEIKAALTQFIISGGIIETKVVAIEGGWTARDEFAKAALSLGEGVWEGKRDDCFEEMARTFYRIADAMLAERAK